MVRAIGGRAARRYFLTAERIDAPTAQHLGLVHEVVAADALDSAVAGIIAHLRKGGRQAQATSKHLVELVRETDPSIVRTATAEQIASVRVGAEAQEGLAAFLEKRKPAWAAGEGS